MVVSCTHLIPHLTLPAVLSLTTVQLMIVVFMEIADSSLNITSSTFNNNRAAHSGGVMYTSNSSLNITSGTFTNNRANMQSGVMNIVDSSFVIITNNTVEILVVS